MHTALLAVIGVLLCSSVCVNAYTLSTSRIISHKHKRSMLYSSNSGSNNNNSGSSSSGSNSGRTYANDNNAYKKSYSPQVAKEREREKNFKEMDGKEWKSGYIFNNNSKNGPPRRMRNDPWWMRDEEKNNPRMLPEYKPWWVDTNTIVNDTWKVADLRKEAERRGIDPLGKKNELIERLVESSKTYSLTDDNFFNPIFTESNNDKLISRNCFPQTYNK